MENGRKVLVKSSSFTLQKHVGERAELAPQDRDSSEQRDRTINLTEPIVSPDHWVKLSQRDLMVLARMSAYSRRWVQYCCDKDPTIRKSVEKDIEEINSIDKILLDAMSLFQLDNMYGFDSI